MPDKESARLTLVVEFVLPVDLLLVCVHELFPAVPVLPLGGSEVTQLALTVIPAITVVELCHCGRRCWRAVRAWCRPGDEA